MNLKEEVQTILRDAYNETSKWLDFALTQIEERDIQVDELIDENEELLRENQRLKEEILALNTETDILLDSCSDCRYKAVGLKTGMVDDRD